MTDAGDGPKSSVGRRRQNFAELVPGDAGARILARGRLVDDLANWDSDPRGVSPAVAATSSFSELR